MALMTNPKVLLLDEPTAGMTAEETNNTEFCDLRGRVSIVAIEHDMSFVRALSCHTIVMHQGRLIASGEFTEISETTGCGISTWVGTENAASHQPVSLIRSCAFLAGVDIGVNRGEIVVLLGRQRGRQTTLLRTLIGIVRPSAGQVEFDGTDITGGPPHRTARLGIAYVPQGRGIFPKLTVRENLIVGTRARADGRQQVPESIFRYFPVLSSAAANLGAPCREVSSKCWRSPELCVARRGSCCLTSPPKAFGRAIVHNIGSFLREW